MKNKYYIAITIITLCIIIFFSIYFLFIRDTVDDKLLGECIVVGADLDTQQIQAIYYDFFRERGNIKEFTISTSYEMQYLSNRINNGIIDDKANVGVYIKTFNQNMPLTVTTNNVILFTENMYASSLSTAGICNSNILISAPHPVRGDSVITSIFKGYEEINGPIDENYKQAAVYELILLDELALSRDSEKAVSLIRTIKSRIEDFSDADNSKVIELIYDIAKSKHIKLNENETIKISKMIELYLLLDTSDWKIRFKKTSN